MAIERLLNELDLRVAGRFKAVADAKAAFAKAGERIMESVSTLSKVEEITGAARAVGEGKVMDSARLLQAVQTFKNPPSKVITQSIATQAAIDSMNNVKLIEELAEAQSKALLSPSMKKRRLDAIHAFNNMLAMNFERVEFQKGLDVLQSSLVPEGLNYPKENYSQKLIDLLKAIKEKP